MIRSPARFLYPFELAWLFLGLASVSFAHRTAAESLSGMIDETNFQRFTFVLVALTIVVSHLRRVPRFRLNPISVFLIYVLVGVCSSLWSAGPVTTLGKSIELLTAVLIVWITMVKADAEVRLRRLVYWTLIEIVAGLLYIALGNIFDPGEFHQSVLHGALLPYNWSSPRISDNGASVLGALVGSFCLAEALTTKKRSWFWLFLFCYLASMAFPVLTQGRAGMLAFAVATVLILARRLPISSVFLLPATAALGILPFGDTLFRLFMRGENEELVFSLSGRTSMWELGWTAFQSRPWFGSGWGVGSRELFLSHSEHALTGLVHNGALEVLLGVGLIGFAVWAWAVIWSWWLVAADYLRGSSSPLAVGMIPIIAGTFTLNGVGGWLEFSVQYFLVITALLWLRQHQRVRATAVRSARLPSALPRPRWNVP